MRALEATSMQAARNAQADAGAFERSLGDYLQSLLAADGERRAADDETFHEVAIAIGVKDDDARFVLARAVGTARRASLPLRRFRQPWLLGALWEADADPISAALDLPEEMPRTASLVVLSAHADGLRIAADDARHAGLEALRDFLLFGARMQRTGNAGSAESFRDAPEVRGIAARVQAAGKARRRAERQAIASIAAMDPELGEHFMLVWERATFPEFFADGRAWRDASDLAAAGIPEIRSDSGAARAAAALERWRMADQDMVRRLSEWQDARTAIAAPASPAELAVAAAQDAELGALRTLRDESAWRLLRQVAVAQGRSPDALMRDDPRMGSLQRPAQWAP
jgi:hypothetical protein